MQTTLDAAVAEKALKKIKDVLLKRQTSPAPKLYRDPNDPYFAEIRKIAADIICEWFASKNAPILRDALINRVYEVIKGKQLRGEWPYPTPRYDTIRRRINELIEPQVVGEPTPAIAIEANILGRTTTAYFPNPLRVAPEKREQLLEIIRDWENAKKARRNKK
ncbi:MAG: hypothetical protein DRP00_06180 [Candidatus Aenigmatarchaeota archaeon]|nr:MAG: hypothetical protein DRP00_06180 [Candidatus Aenigmarchaeota archaeon]